jgi:methionyl aminopeptidase
MEDFLKFFKKSERIAEKVVKFSKKLVKNGEKIVSIASSIEEKILKLGGKPAWPVNICINEIAAHYTPFKNEETKISENDFVKVDIGIHVNGYISDNAFTICLTDPKNELITAAEKALLEGTKVVKSGVKIKEISEAIYSTLESLNVKPVINLCGHSIERYSQHGGISIPNVLNNIEKELKTGQIVALEVFTTSGSGWVEESSPANIFQFRERKPVRMNEARKILELAEREFEKLPFAKRWLEIPEGKVDLAISQLIDVGAIKPYPPLKESHGKVAVAEKTILVK